jgi:hypothetical protein
MIRWVSFLVCVIFGLGMIVCGLQVPAHLRAVDAIVLQQAGRGTPSLTDGGLSLVKHQQLGAAQLFLAAAGAAGLPEAARLSEAVNTLASGQPGLGISGSVEAGRWGDLLASGRGTSESNSGQLVSKPEAITEFIIRSDHRTKALEMLESSSNSVVQALMHFRSLTNTVLFPASASTSGQALDAAVAMGGLLAETGHFSMGLSNAVLGLAAEANRAGNPEPLEQGLMDLMTLGQRFNWGQLAQFVEPIQDVETLRELSDLVRRGESVPVIYSAVCLTGNAAGVAQYLTTFGATGLSDLRVSLAYGTGGVNELLQRNQRLCNSGFCEHVLALTSSGTIFTFAVDYSQKEPGWALAVKWLLYFVGGFLLAAAFHFVRRVTTLEKPLEVRGFHVVREMLFALGFLVVVLLLSEPFLAQGSQKVEFSFRLRLPTMGGAVPAGSPGAHTTIMNQVTFLTMLLFFVLQALLYVASLVKLSEIRRQGVSSRMKLKLLENEDHLFDAGLYLGFLGTIISLILVSLGVFKQPSLMAAYSSTSFGILFVVLFKVVHLRRARRHMLLQAEAESYFPAPTV